MSDQDDKATDESQDSELVRKLREEIKQRDAALNEERQQRTTLERQQAFRDAGVDPTSGPGKLLFENFDGEATADSVKEKAAEYGLNLTAPSPGGSEQETVDEREKATMREMDRAASGNTPEAVPESPQQAAHEAFDREMATSGSRREAMAKSFNARMISALEAQKRGTRP